MTMISKVTYLKHSDMLIIHLRESEEYSQIVVITPAKFAEIRDQVEVALRS